MPVTRELLIGSETIAFFSDVRGVLSVDADLVRMRIYTPDGAALLADIGLSPQRARAIAARLFAGANKIDPGGAVSAVPSEGPRA